MRTVVIACLALTACGSDRLAFRLDVPLEDANRSLVVALEISATENVNRSLKLYAFDLDEGRGIDPVESDFDLDRAVDVTAMRYDQGLSQLPLQPGKLREALPEEYAVPIPVSLDLLSSSIRDGETTGDWARVGQAPQAVLDFRIRGDNPCGVFANEEISLTEAGEITFALGVDDEHVLLGTDSRSEANATPEVLVVDRAGNVDRLEMPTTFFDAYQQDDGTIWLGGRNGIVWQGIFQTEPAISLEITASSTISTEKNIYALDGPKDKEGQQFALTRSGDFEFFDGTSWDHKFDESRPNDIVYIRDNYGLMSWGYELFVRGWDGTKVIEEPMPSVTSDGVESIETVPGFGVVAGACHGQIFIKPDKPNGDPDEWFRSDANFTSLADGEATPTRVVPYGESFVWLRKDAIVQYAGEGPANRCPPHAPQDTSKLFDDNIAAVGRDIVACVNGPDYGPQSIVWFRRTD